MSDEQRRIAALERLIADQQELIEKQRESIDQQDRLIEKQSATISQHSQTIDKLAADLRRRGKTRLLPKQPGLWMVKRVHKKPGRPRSDKVVTIAKHESMLTYQKAHGYKSMEAALVGRISELYPPKNREDLRKIEAMARRINNRFRRRNQLE